MLLWHGGHLCTQSSGEDLLFLKYCGTRGKRKAGSEGVVCSARVPSWRCAVCPEGPAPAVGSGEVSLPELLLCCDVWDAVG